MKPDLQTLLTETKENLQDMMTHLEMEAGKMGLRINSNKAKIILVGNIQMNTSVGIGHQPIEDVEWFTYLTGLVKHLQCSTDCTQFGLCQQLASRPKYESATLSSYQL